MLLNIPNTIYLQLGYSAYKHTLQHTLLSQYLFYQVKAIWVLFLHD